MKNLTPEQIATIPALKAQGYTTLALARLFGCHQTSINYWFRRLRASGHEIPVGKAGRPPVKIAVPAQSTNTTTHEN